jgi:hypothetical protein
MPPCRSFETDPDRPLLQSRRRNFSRSERQQALKASHSPLTVHFCRHPPGSRSRRRFHLVKGLRCVQRVQDVEGKYSALLARMEKMESSQTELKASQGKADDNAHRLTTNIEKAPS